MTTIKICNKTPTIKNARDGKNKRKKSKTAKPTETAILRLRLG